MKRILHLLSVLGLIAGVNLTLLAQDRTVTGRVTASEDGSPIPGVNVVVKGTSTGNVTGSDGRYSIGVPDNATLVFSFIGLVTQEIAVGNRSTIDVQMASDVKALQEIVVTAQGIERDQRTLGYAVQSVKGEALSQRSTPDVLNALQGKVAGVNIVGASGAPGASTNINIRGISSFGGSNQPLIVVDGIIFSNDLNNSQNTLFGSQPGNRLADINPESIESVNILKGPAAAVLYGSRASAGAIVITTKSGRGLQNKTEVTVNSSVNFQNVYGLPPFQNEYGQGINNDYVPTSTNSWGPRFGTLESVVNTQGETVPFEAYPNNVRDFYKTGNLIQNSVNIASGKENASFALSAGSALQEGVIPNTDFKRHNVQMTGNTKLNNGLALGASLSYVKTQQTGVPQGNGGSAFGQLTRIPRSFDLAGRPFQDALGRSIYYSTTQNHPLWSTEYERVRGNVDRAFGYFTLGYDVFKWLNVTYRVTGDTYFDRRNVKLEVGSARAPLGQTIIDNFFRSEFNGDLLITAKQENLFFEDFDATLLLGQNINQRFNQQSTVFGESLGIPFFDNPVGASVFSQSEEESFRRRLLGYYGQLSLGFRDYAFLELSGRADQSSTLPRANNTYFYPAASVSFVPTDAFGIKSNVFSYAKVRASVARVGRDADPYLLTPVLYERGAYGNNLASIAFPITTVNGPIAGFSPDENLGNPNLKPEFVTSAEAGINIGLFQNRFGVDLTYYNQVSTNQIFNVALSNASGFDTQTTNVGKMTNRGIELLLTATPVQTTGFKWEVALNFTRNRNIVNEIAPGVDNSVIAGDAFIGISPSIKVGQPYGVIIGTANARNDQGQLLISPLNGLFVPGIAGQVIATPQPDYIAGLTNSFSFKGLSLSVLVDTRQGGNLYSFGAVDVRSNGGLDITGADRDQPRILPGVIAVTDADGNVSYRPNNIQISAQSYWGALGGLASEGAVFDATVYRLREASLNYTLPAKWFTKLPFGSVTFGVSGRNLLFYAPGYFADPEVNTQGAGNIQGLDLNGAPNTRNYGFNLRFTL